MFVRAVVAATVIVVVLVTIARGIKGADWALNIPTKEATR